MVDEMLDLSRRDTRAVFDFQSCRCGTEAACVDIQNAYAVHFGNCSPRTASPLSNLMRLAERRRPLGTSLELGVKKGGLKVFDQLPDLTKHRKNL